MQSLASPAEVGAAVSAAALGKGATPEQADALGAAATAAAQASPRLPPVSQGSGNRPRPGQNSRARHRDRMRQHDLHDCGWPDDELRLSVGPSADHDTGPEVAFWTWRNRMTVA